MLEKFWDGLATKLADRWAAISGPALAFWLVVGGAWATGHGGLARVGSRIDSLDGHSVLLQAVILIVGLLAATGSMLLVERLTKLVVPLLMGSWPRWTGWFRRLLARRFRSRAAALESEWQLAADRVYRSGSSTDQDERRMVELDRLRRRYPAKLHQVMPTRVGNMLRASESRPYEKYGLEASVVWPRLWTVLPESTKKELSMSWGQIGSSASVMVWSVLLVPFSLWTPLVLIAAGGGFLFGYLSLPDRVESFGDLLESAFDVHRGDLYVKLRWPLPKQIEDETKLGLALTEFLFRGTTAEPITFVDHGGEDS